MRTSLVLSAVGLPFVLAACNSLLGDFTVSDAGVGDAGVGDAAVDAMDAATDAPTLFRLSCSEASSQRMKLTSNPIHPDLVRIAQTASGVRVVAVDYSPLTDGGPQGATLLAYTLPSNTPTNVQSTTAPTGATRVLALRRYGGAAPGFAALYVALDKTSAPELYLQQLADGDTAWGAPMMLCAAPGPSDGTIEATIAPIDPSNQQFFVAYSVTKGTSQDIYMGALSPNGPALPTTPVHFTTSAGRPAWTLFQPDIAQHDKQPPYVMLDPNGNGPPPTGSPVKILVPGGQDLTLQPPSNLNFFPTAFDDSTDPLEANVAFLVADLNSFVGAFHVGRVPYASLSSFDPQSLPATLPPGDGGAIDLSKLFVVGSTQHWETYPPYGEQFLVVAPTADPVAQVAYPGMNFAWWDGATGALRAYEGGQGASLLGNVPFVGSADVTIASLVGSIASIDTAFTSDLSPPGHGPPPSGDVYFTVIACVKQ